MPVSAVLSSADIMMCIKPGHHGSTFGGNPLASAVGIASLRVLKEERLAERADELGQMLRQALNASLSHYPFVRDIRGRGLLNAIEIDESFHTSAWDICLMLKDKGLLAKPTHSSIIRLAPPLVMTVDQLKACVAIIQSVFAYVGREELSASPELRGLHIGRIKQINK